MPEHDKHSPATRYGVNYKLLVISIAVFGIAAAAIYFWHARIVAQMSSSFLTEAKEEIQAADDLHDQVSAIIKDKELDDQTRQKIAQYQLDAGKHLNNAVEQIGQYRRANPQDIEALILLVKTYDRSPKGIANPARAAELYVDAIVRTQDLEIQRDLRLRAGELFLTIENYSVAESTARQLMDEPVYDNDTEFTASVRRILAWALLGSIVQDQVQARGPDSSVDYVGAEIANAVKENPSNSQLAVKLALLYRNKEYRKYLSVQEQMELSEKGEPAFEQRADQIVDDLVQRNTDSPDAYLARYGYRKNKDPVGADADLNLAHDLAPDNPVINYEIGLSLKSRARQLISSNLQNNSDQDEERTQLLLQAKSAFEATLKRAPQFVDAHRELGDVQSLLGETGEAIKTWKTGLEINDNVPPLHERLIGGLIDENRLDEAQKQLKDLGQLVDQLVGSSVTNRRSMFNLQRSKQYLLGALQYKQNKIGDAIATLEKLVLEERMQPTRQSLRALRLLGQIFADLDQPARAASYYETAAKINVANADEDDVSDRSQREFQRLLTRARRDAGQFNLAADTFESLVNQSTSASDWLELASMLYNAQLREPIDLRDWSRFIGALANAERFNQLDDTVPPWRLEYMQLKGELARAGGNNVADGSFDLPAALQNLEQAVADNPTVLRDLVLIHESLGNDEDSARLLEKYNHTAGAGAERYIFNAELLAREGDFEGAFNQLQDGISQVPDNEKADIELAAIYLDVRQGNAVDGYQKLKNMAGKDADNPGLVLALADLARQMPDKIQKTDMADLMARLVSVEGQNGPYANYLTAQQLILDQESTPELTDRENMVQKADVLNGNVMRLRPSWFPAHTLAGLIHETKHELARLGFDDTAAIQNTLKEERDKVIKSYTRAVELGERSPNVILRLSELVRDPQQQRQWLSLLDRNVIASNQTLANLQAAILLSHDEIDSAKSIAEQATAARPDDPSAWLTRARVELRAEQIPDAETSVEKAKSLATKSDSALVSMLAIFDFYMNAERYTASVPVEDWHEKARQFMPTVVELAEDKDKRFIEAQLYDALNDKKAAETYLLAERADPENQGLLARMLHYFSTRNLPEKDTLDEAIRIAQKLVDLDERNPRYRQQLANLLARRGSLSDWDQVHKVLISQAPNPDARTYAALILNRTQIPNPQRHANLAAAAKLLENAASTKTTLDLILLAQTYRSWASLLNEATDQRDRDDKLAKAESNFVAAGAKDNITANHLAAIVDFFIEHPKHATGEQPTWEQAEFYLLRLNDKLGSSPLSRIVSVRLTAKLLKARGTDEAEITELIQDFGDEIKNVSGPLTRRERGRLYQQVASIFESVELNDEAMLWRQDAANANEEQNVLLAIAIAKSGDKLAALKRCSEAYAESESPSYVQAIASVLLMGELEPEHLKIAESVITKALAKHANNIVVLMNIGNVRIAAQERIDEGIDLYKAALSIKPNNEVLLNNLATAYTERTETLPQALETINRAIKIHGEQSGLIDTKAVILMLQGKLDESHALLKEVVNPDADSRYWLHLAEVCWRKFEQSQRQQDANDAQFAYQKSMKLGLENEILTPGEKNRLATLRTNLNEHKLGSKNSNELPSVESHKNEPASPGGYSRGGALIAANTPRLVRRDLLVFRLFSVVSDDLQTADV